MLPHSNKVSTGRGGAGNLRAASRTRAADAVEPSEDELRERSRERSRERGLVGGRGGAGNFRSASKQPADRIREQREEEEAEQAEVSRDLPMPCPIVLICRLHHHTASCTGEEGSSRS